MHYDFGLLTLDTFGLVLAFAVAFVDTLAVLADVNLAGTVFLLFAAEAGNAGVFASSFKTCATRSRRCSFSALIGPLKDSKSRANCMAR